MNYSVFIISHGRADRVETYDTLRNAGYHGPINIVVDVEEEKEYRKRFGSEVISFDKFSIMEKSDVIYPVKKKSSALYSRIFVEMCASSMIGAPCNLDGYVVLDDDITNLRYRWIDGKSIKSMPIRKNLSAVFDSYIEYIVSSGIATASFIYNMFYVSGASGIEDRITESRHTYQIHIRNLSRPIEWKSLTNNDTITEDTTMKTGDIWWSLPFVDFDAVPMNTKSGGMKILYDSISDYAKNFLAVVACPSSCKVGYSESTRGKIRIVENRNTLYPMIVSSRYKK